MPKWKPVRETLLRDEILNPQGARPKAWVVKFRVPANGVALDTLVFPPEEWKKFWWISWHCQVWNDSLQAACHRRAQSFLCGWPDCQELFGPANDVEILDRIDDSSSSLRLDVSYTLNGTRYHPHRDGHLFGFGIIISPQRFAILVRDAEVNVRATGGVPGRTYVCLLQLGPVGSQLSSPTDTLNFHFCKKVKQKDE